MPSAAAACIERRKSAAAKERDGDTEPNEALECEGITLKEGEGEPTWLQAISNTAPLSLTGGADMRT